MIAVGDEYVVFSSEDGEHSREVGLWDAEKILEDSLAKSYSESYEQALAHVRRNMVKIVLEDVNCK